MIRGLAADGVPKARIVEQLGISRTTVVKAVASTDSPKYERQSAPTRSRRTRRGCGSCWCRPRICRRRCWLNGSGGWGRSAGSGRTSSTSAVPVRGSIRLIGSAGRLRMPRVLPVRGRPRPSGLSVFGVHSHGSQGQSLVPLLCRGSRAQSDECRVATMSGGGCALLCPLRSFASMAASVACRKRVYDCRGSIGVGCDLAWRRIHLCSSRPSRSLAPKVHSFTLRTFGTRHRWEDSESRSLRFGGHVRLRQATWWRRPVFHVKLSARIGCRSIVGPLPSPAGQSVRFHVERR